MANTTSNVLGFREQENSPLDVQFGPNDLLRADAYILAVINNQYLDDVGRIKFVRRELPLLMLKIANRDSNPCILVKVLQKLDFMVE